MSTPCDSWTDRLSAKADFGGIGWQASRVSGAFGLAIYPNPALALHRGSA
jgi:hypothetical protein